MNTDTIPAPPPTEPSNTVPDAHQYVLNVEWRGRALSLPRINAYLWQREVRMSADARGVLSVQLGPYEHISRVEIAITRTTMTRKRRVNSAASGELGTSIADLLADACEGIDRIPEEFWELMAAPLEGEES